MSDEQKLVRYISALSVLYGRERDRGRRRAILAAKDSLAVLIDAATLIDEEDALIAAGKRPPLPPVLLRPMEEMRGG